MRQRPQGRYLCASNVNLATPEGLIAAVYGYNHSLTYVANVVLRRRLTRA